MLIKFGKLKNFIVLVIIFITYFFYVKITGTNANCVFKHTVGIPCPGCGLSRAWYSFLKFDFADAFYFHPLFWTIPFLVIVFVFRKRGKVKMLYQSDRFWLFILILFLFVYIIRMLFLFPNHAPMDINKDSLLFKIIRFLF